MLAVHTAADDSKTELAITEVSLGKLPANAVKYSMVVSPDVRISPRFGCRKRAARPKSDSAPTANE